MKMNLSGFMLLMLIPGLVLGVGVPSKGVEADQPGMYGGKTLEAHIAAEKQANVIIILCLVALTMLTGGF